MEFYNVDTSFDYFFGFIVLIFWGPAAVQFIREYTGKVDELVKHKIETQNEVKAKEQEDKEVIAQQVHAVFLHVNNSLLSAATQSIRIWHASVSPW